MAAIGKGVTAVIGSGGKTSLIAALCRRLPGSVIVCTSTHIYPAEGMPLVTEPLTQLPARCVCVGTPGEQGKLTAPIQSFEELSALADYVLVEADGAKRLPLKAHLPYEPVIPACAGQVIGVVGLSGLGQTVREAVHRPEQFARLCGADLTDPVTPEMVAKVLNAENLADFYILNQADDENTAKKGKKLGKLLQKPYILASLRQGEFHGKLF